MARGSVGDLLKDPGSVEVAQILGYENILPLVPRTSGGFELADAGNDESGSRKSIVFKSSGHRIGAWKVRPEGVELGVGFDMSDGLVTMNAVCLVLDAIDLGTYTTAVLSSNRELSLELDLTETYPGLGAGTVVELSVELDPRTTSVLSKFGDAT